MTTVSFDDCEVRTGTDRALKIYVPDLDEAVWIPKSIIHDDSEVYDAACPPGMVGRERGISMNFPSPTWMFILATVIVWQYPEPGAIWLWPALFCALGVFRQMYGYQRLREAIESDFMQQRDRAVGEG